MSLSAASPSLADLSAVEAVTALRAGEILAEDYAEALLERAESGAALRAFTTLEPEGVRAAARAADRHRLAGARLGLLHGLPVPVKDSFVTRALPTSHGTAALRGSTTRRDAGLVRRVLEAGAIVFGKTHLHELSMGWTGESDAFGMARNPYNLEFVPGGSSAGSAVAVAARMAPLALAEDTLGSIRIPAAFCGIAGFRPTHNRYPNDGVMPLTLGRLDQTGAMARRVADLALLDAVVSGESSLLEPKPPREIRLGFSPDFLEAELEPEVERTWLLTRRRLEEAGVRWVELDLPGSVRSALGICQMLLQRELHESISRFLAEHHPGHHYLEVAERAGPSVKRALLAAASARYAADSHARAAAAASDRLRVEFTQLIRENYLDALVYPPTLCLPGRIGQGQPRPLDGSSSWSVKMARNVACASCGGLPSLTLPTGLAQGGLPTALVLDGLPGADRALLALGRALEDALPPMPVPRLSLG